jgi:hypothetical protein
MKPGTPGSWKALFADHWRDRGFLQWFWREQIPLEAKLATGLVVVGALAGAGVWAAANLRAGSASADRYIVETTVMRTTVVREHGKPVRKLVSVVRTVRLRPQTISQLQTVFVAGEKQVLATNVVRLVPSVEHVTTTTERTHVVTNNKTVTNQQTVVNQETVTNQQTVVNQQTVTNERTVTNQQTVTNPQTITNERTVTNQQTVTNLQTVTRTVTNTDTVTVTQTQTETVTRTVLGPTVTVTTTGP